MKTLICSLLLFFGFALKSQTNTPMAPYVYEYDTTKFQINYVPDIIATVYDCFKQSTFGPMIVFTKEKVDFINASDSTKILGECVAAEEAIIRVQKIFGNLNYCCFKIGHKALANGDDLIKIRVFIFPDKEDYGVTVYICISQHRYISVIGYE
jgi:hypothetical protein